MTRRHLLSLVLVLPFAGGAFALPPEEDNIAAVTERLRATTLFAFGGVGYAGRISSGELAFMTLLTQPRAVAMTAFESVFAHGQAAGRCYALVGIHALEPALFKQLAAQLIDVDAPVSTAHGCILDDEMLSSIASTIAKGAYDRFVQSVHPAHPAARQSAG